MKHSFKKALVIFWVVAYSCNSAPKKRPVDSVEKTNLQTHAVQPQNSKSGKEQPKDTTLVFPAFTIRLHDFDVHGGADGNGKYYYNGDSYEGRSNLDEKKDFWSLNINTNTAHLQVYGWAQSNLIEILPKDKSDNFKISYYNRVSISEFENDKGVRLTINAPYKSFKDSATYFFKIPNGGVYDLTSDTAEVKKLLNLKDTSITYKAIDGKFYTNKDLVIYKHKACNISAISPTYFKIERFNGNKLIETKFLIIEGINSESVD